MNGQRSSSGYVMIPVTLLRFVLLHAVRAALFSRLGNESGPTVRCFVLYPLFIVGRLGLAHGKQPWLLVGGTRASGNFNLLIPSHTNEKN
ncbi:hypothetical protein B296_00046596 [Ensete ventricosum]|uniref:Secreted protein n=1 Tax=Ensete ventricosum TaxID=4639 RepID=A0A426YQP0_ENSVE|nr:hypothetical protein B296_00046596 [Ensete ventricosum]